MRIMLEGRQCMPASFLIVTFFSSIFPQGFPQKIKALRIQQVSLFSRHCGISSTIVFHLNGTYLNSLFEFIE
jgi:hypothetical protein